MDFISHEIEQYAQLHTSAELPLLKKLNRDTHAKILMPRMLSGHLQGTLLRMLSKMIKPERILEIGTYTGYSALCLAEGLTENGKLITIDINEELKSFTESFFSEAGMREKITTHTGDAMKIIPSLNESFDLVFIDADKINYLNYYHLIFDKVKKGGFIIADNVLWSGKVLDEKKDKDTEAICQFNTFIKNDSRILHLLLPVRDGLMLIQKI